MNMAAPEIERIVREVLARLSQTSPDAAHAALAGHAAAAVGPAFVGQTVASQTSASQALASPPTASQTAIAEKSAGGDDAHELSLPEKVVTVASLSGRLSGIKRLVVPARAVVTPSARDLLLKARVELVRTAAEVGAAVGGARGVADLKNAAPGRARGADNAPLDGARGPRASSGKLYLHFTEPSRSASRAMTDGGWEGWTVETLVACDVAQAVAELSAVLTSGPARLGVLYTQRRDAALWLANRRAGVRAASATDIASVATAVGEIGANLLVIDATRIRPAGARNLIRRFLQGGPRDCPEKLKAFA
ncbi:MAG TPA: hypothetical protein PLV92_06375 [Pirellulaceae bacterium]|nr:hypothetical protein [Pirellulaceae bacterium]